MSQEPLPSTESPEPALDRAEVARRRRRQAAFLCDIGELKQDLLRALDRVTRLEEIATTGMTSTKALVAEFRAGWEKQVGRTYVPNNGLEGGVMRRLLKRLAAAEIRERMALYFASREAFILQEQFSITLFERRINTLGSAPAATTRPGDNVLDEEGWFKR